MAQAPRVRRPEKTKYTLLVDHSIQDYQLHLKRHTNVNFSDLVRALILRCASDPQLEARIFEDIGGGYYEDYEPTPSSAPQPPAPAADPVPEPPSAEASSPRQDDGGEFWTGG